jgi:hypothetical protein
MLNADLDPDPGGQKWPTNIEKKERIFMFWNAGCSFLRAEDFSLCLCVLYGDLGITKLQFFYQKNILFFWCKFFPIFGHQNPGFKTGFGSGSAIRKNTGSGSVSGSALNQCGSTTLVWLVSGLNNFSNEEIFQPLLTNKKQGNLD